jgi:anti-sigma factor RsiW
MTRHPAEAELHELVDGTLAPDDRRRVERHVADCVACTAAVRRIESLVQRARALSREVEPPAEAWEAVRIAIAGRERTTVALEESSRGNRHWVRLAAAAAALMVVTAGTTLWVAGTDDPSSPNIARNLDTPAPAQLAAFAPVEARYVLAVSALRSTLDERREQLDPATIATVERSLAVIDSAIAEARAALATDPANATLTRLLSSSYEQKVELLRRASELTPRS